MENMIIVRSLDGCFYTFNTKTLEKGKQLSRWFIQLNPIERRIASNTAGVVLEEFAKETATARNLAAYRERLQKAETVNPVERRYNNKRAQVAKSISMLPVHLRQVLQSKMNYINTAKLNNQHGVAWRKLNDLEREVCNMHSRARKSA